MALGNRARAFVPVAVDPTLAGDLYARSAPLKVEISSSDTLDEALADCSYVAGTSARARTIGWPTMTPRECAERLGLAFERRATGYGDLATTLARWAQD